MTDWTSGYVADVGYTYGYCPELNPLRVKLALLSGGVAPPAISVACELGFGQGLSVNIHAAASKTTWYGTDFNPAQAGFAQQMAAVSGSDAHLYDQSFAEFVARSDLPDFDFIGLHGIWSWISDDNRAAIVDFVRRKLRVGGVLYISYNTLPGWAGMAPLRDLLIEHADVLGARGHGTIKRVDDAIKFADRLFSANPAYARANPSAKEKLKQIQGENRNYVAHEYFNRDWLPIPFTRMCKWLEPAKLQFVRSAHYLDQLDALYLSIEQQALLKDIPDLLFRQTVRDFCVNQVFRRDYWVKGARRIDPVEQHSALRSQRVVLVVPRTEVSRIVTARTGGAKPPEAIYEPILDALADHRPKLLGEIEKGFQGKVNLAHVTEAVTFFVGTGVVSAVADDTSVARAKPQTDKINAYITTKARGSTEINHVASPLTAAGFAVSRTDQMFLEAFNEGKKTPAAWVQYSWNIMLANGQRLMKDAKPIEAAEENIAELTRRAQVFERLVMPMLKVLHVT